MFVDKTQTNSAAQNARQLHVRPNSSQTADSCGKTGVKAKTLTRLKLVLCKIHRECSFYYYFSMLSPAPTVIYFFFNTEVWLFNELREVARFDEMITDN